MGDQSSVQYPCITREEAEALVDFIGWHDSMRTWANMCGQPVETMDKDDYVVGLMYSLKIFLECDEDEPFALLGESYDRGVEFYERANECAQLVDEET